MHATTASFKASAAITLLLLSSIAPVAGHVILENPKPYKFAAYGPTNPIEPDASDFPCKVPAGATLEPDGAATVMAIGEDQKLSFLGQAVHGGGSCQLSLTRDFPPTKDSAWKVIHSIEGGCPARNQAGNLDGPNEDVYTFQIPQGIEPGDWVFAWTWVARIGGQPEFYMNCAPITVVDSPSAAKNKVRSRVDARGRPDFAEWTARDLEAREQAAVSFPDMFMANMGELTGGCTTDDARVPQVAIRYPSPGASVDQPEGADNLYPLACDGNPRRGVTAPDEEESSQSATVPTQSETEVPNPPAPSSSSAIVRVPDTPITITSPAASSSTPAKTTNERPAETTSAVPDGNNNNNEQGSCTEGYLTCLDDGQHFATCTGGRLTAPQPLAPGFHCAPGENEGLQQIADE